MVHGHGLRTIQKKDPVNKELEHWIQEYLQAAAQGNKNLMRIYAAIITKLGGTPPKL